MRLRTKYAIVFLVTMLVLGGVVFVSTERFRREIVDQEQSDLDRTATRTARQIDRSIREQVDYVRWYAAQPRVGNFGRAERNLQSFVNSSNFYAAQVVAANGTVIAFEGEINESRRKAVVGTDVSDRSYVQKALRGGTVVSNPEKGSFTAVTISTPIFELTDAGTTEVEGVFIGAIRVDASGFFVAKEPLESRRQTVLITGESASGETIVLDPASRSFEAALTSTATVETTGWTVTIRRDRSGLARRLDTLRLIQGGGLLLVVLSFAGLSVWEYRTNLQQTRRLLDGFDALERGEYDHEVDLRAAEEWRQISEGFNDLAKSLETRESELREREQQMSVINRVLRHNLKNEMTVIRGHAELLPNRDSQESRKEVTETIQAAAERLLSHSRKARHIEDAIESAEAGPISVYCSNVVREVLAEVRQEYPDVDCESDVEDDVNARAISALDYAVESIVENAFRHNDSDEPRVTVSVEEDVGTVKIRVADNGPGIPVHEIEVLDKPAETGLEHGSGVGLWVAYWIVKQSEGTLRFERRQPTGTVVTIELDAADDRDR